MKLAATLCATIFLLQACAPVGSRHTPDAVLERTFKSHQAEFESLCAELEASSQLTTLFAGDRADLHENNIYAMKRAGLPKENVAKYEEQLRRLGLWCITKGGRGLEFRVDPGSVTNGDSYKGFYWYREGQPPDIRPSLDEYRFSKSDKDLMVYKALKGHWYLYIFVNR
jgi:hypothetical protein